MMNSALREITPPVADAPRYSARAFPPYRYVPGLHPHPVAHPEGHSYRPSGGDHQGPHRRDAGTPHRRDASATPHPRDAGVTPHRRDAGVTPHRRDASATPHRRDAGATPHRLETGATLLPPERWAESDDYLYGADLYNHGYWWEAHEAWEGLWQQTDKAGRQGRFLQGLIQVSAAHLKRHVGQADGVARLLERAFAHLNVAWANDPPGTRYMGLDLGAFIQSVRGYFEGRETVFPKIVLAAD